MELLWQDGQVVVRNQNQRSEGNKKFETAPFTDTREIRSAVVEEETTPSNLFMQEDEMASWLHYPIDDNSLDRYLYSNDLLCSAPPSSAPVTTAPSFQTPPPPPSPPAPSPQPPVLPFGRGQVESSQPKHSNFVQFTNLIKLKNTEPVLPRSKKIPPAIKQSTVVESNDTPAAEAPESRTSRFTDDTTLVSGGSMRGIDAGAAGPSSERRELETCDRNLTASPDTSSSGASGEPSSEKPPLPSDDRKRKARDTDDNQGESEDVEFESHDPKKQSQGSTSTKRSRAAEVHNLSERKRRDRINEKMKALQELIPRCNKVDKASMLDEAIEYLKSLQLQVQMMSSMGCNMVPMMFPSVQQYMSPMAMHGMGMDMGMNYSMVPYPHILPNSVASSAPPPSHLAQCSTAPGFQVPPVSGSGAARCQAPLMINPVSPQSQSQPRVLNFAADPYQQYVRLHQTQSPLPQNQRVMPSSKPNSSKDVRNPQHHQTG